MLLLGLAVGSVAGPAGAAEVTVDELLRLSGLRAQLGTLRALAQGQFMPPPSPLTAAEQATVAGILARALAPERLYPLIRAEFSRLMDAQRMSEAAVWFRSPLGRRLADREAAIGSPQEFEPFAASLRRTPPTLARRALAERLDWASGATEVTVELILAVNHGLARAARLALPPERRLKLGRLDDDIARLRPRVADAVREAALPSLLFSYRAFTDEELTTYAAFLGSPAGRWYNAASRRAVVHAMRALAEPAAVEVLHAVPLERWRPADAAAPSR